MDRDARLHEQMLDTSEARALNEIAYFEARLAAMGHSGDCAYEKSLVRAYRRFLRQRKYLLASLRCRQTAEDIGPRE